MSEYTVSALHPSDKRARAALDALLGEAGIALDAHLDETIGLYDGRGALVAAGSLAGNTLRSIAVSPSRQGEGLLGALMTALLERQAARGHFHVFLYTRPESAVLFGDLGFSPIASVPGRLTFMENRRGAFEAYLQRLAAVPRPKGRIAAIIMNANPFTLGHQYLLEHAAGENEAVRCFVVSEDISLVPFRDRLALVTAGAAHLKNVTVHPSGSYIISSATFPAYFLKDARTVTETQAALDIAVFTRIAAAMGVTRRYIGEEPFSQITRIYNEIMQRMLPERGIECVMLGRREAGGAPISASDVRQHIHDGRLEAIRALVPPSTYAYFQTDAGLETIRAIQAASHVRHD